MRVFLLVLAALGVILLGTSAASGRSATAPTLGLEPSVSGVALVGNTLKGDHGTWTGTKPITTTGQWVRCDEKGADCKAISGATEDSYTLTSADVGSTIRFRVTAKNADGSKTADSNETAVVATANGEPANSKPPVVTGFAEVGNTLHTTTGTWVGASPITYDYQWQRCDTAGNACTSISGEREATYKVVSADSGKTLRVRVTAKNSKGSNSAISEHSAIVTGGSGGGGGGGGGNSISVSDIPSGNRLVVDQVLFNPNPVKSRNEPIQIRVRVTDTNGKLVRGAYVFVRSTPILTSTPTDAPTGADGWVTYDVTPRSDFPLRTGYSVQFYVKAYRKGDPTLAGIYGSRLVQVATVSP
jgi:hypothetical protein